MHKAKALPQLRTQLAVLHDGEIVKTLDIDQVFVTMLMDQQGVILIAWKEDSAHKLTPANFLQALVSAKILKPQTPDYAHLPSGVYSQLIANGCLPLKKGETGTKDGDVEGYYISNDPDEACTWIKDALQGDAWIADEDDVAGATPKDGAFENAVKVLWRRVH